MEQKKTIEAKLDQMSLKSHSLATLCKITDELKEFEKHGKEALPTSLQKINKLKKIEAMALAIRTSIQELDNASYFWLDSHLASVPEPQGLHGELGAHIVYKQRMACNLALAARSAAEGIEQRDGKAGRKSVLPAYSGIIAGIAVALKADDIVPGRGGKFEKICEVVFECAGVHAKPEGAIKYFLKNMHSGYKQRGRCL
jgi:hypothetical protein